MVEILRIFAQQTHLASLETVVVRPESEGKIEAK